LDFEPPVFHEIFSRLEARPAEVGVENGSRRPSMKEADSIVFEDLDSGDEGVETIRFDENAVAICLSLKSNGDLELVLTKPVARRLLEALPMSVG
jgi:hypothetical protein